MKGVVVYDSYHGNTKKVAEAIVEEIKISGHEAELRSVREKYPSPPKGDFLFVGSPIRFAKVSRRTKRFVKKLDLESWRNKPMAVFVTIAPPAKEPSTEKERASVQKWVFTGGPKLRDFARGRGLNAIGIVLQIPVKDVKGPLADNAIELTKEYAREFLSVMKR